MHCFSETYENEAWKTKQMTQKVVRTLNMVFHESKLYTHRVEGNREEGWISGS